MNAHPEPSNTSKFISQVLSDPDRKSLLRMLAEVSYFSVKKRAFAKHYFSRFLYRKSNATHFDNYFSDRELISLWKFYNEKAYMDVLENNYLFYLFFHERGFPLPQFLGYNDKNVFFESVSGNGQFIDNPKSLNSWLHGLCQSSIDKKIICKRTFGSFGGKNIFVVREEELPYPQDKAQSFLSGMTASGFIVQEFIQQHPELNRMFAGCINTMRINTLLNKQGKASIFHVFLRMGTGTSFVDNVSSGGLYSGVHIENGKLFPVAWGSLTHGGKHYNSHPDTGIKFSDFTIPQFNEAKNLACRAAESLPSLRFVGWDIAITPDGPVLIEGNPRSSLATVEAAFGGYRSQPAFEPLLREAGLI